MPPPCVHIYADRRGANESLAKWGRSKSTELRPSNEDLRKNSCKCIDWQAAFAPPPAPPLTIPFACVSNANRTSSVGLNIRTTLQGLGFRVSITTYKAIIKNKSKPSLTDAYDTASVMKKCTFN